MEYVFSLASGNRQHMLAQSMSREGFFFLPLRKIDAKTFSYTAHQSGVTGFFFPATFVASVVDNICITDCKNDETGCLGFGAYSTFNTRLLSAVINVVRLVADRFHSRLHETLSRTSDDYLNCTLEYIPYLLLTHCIGG